MNDMLKTDEVIENKIFYHRIYSRLEFISCRNQLTFLYAHYMAGFFMILIPVVEILNTL